MMNRKIRKNFDAAYYKRFYEDPQTRAFGPGDLEQLVGHVASYLNYLRIPVRRALDIGCGLGKWQKALEKHYPRLEFTGIDTSEHLCEEHGWTRASITTFKPKAKYDLVVCQSLLQYLKAGDVQAGLKNMAGLCGGALYLELVTREDWEENCDQTSTDGAIHLRSAAWYRKEIRKYFINCGGGVFLPNDSPVTLYELERIR